MPSRFAFNSQPRQQLLEETILVATADGTSVPMHREDRTTAPSAEAGTARARHGGLTWARYIPSNHSSESRRTYWTNCSASRPPRVVLARRANGYGRRWRRRVRAFLASGSEFVFIEMAIDVTTRDPDRQRTLVCLMDGEQKLWDLQREWLGRSVEILDLFHALKRVREVSKVVQPKDKSRREAWVSDQLRDLLTGKVETVIRRWRRLASEAEQKSDGRKITKRRSHLRSATSAITATECVMTSISRMVTRSEVELRKARVAIW